MDWDHVRIFLAVARSGQLLAAARRLNLDHATVSRRINALEQSMGTKLLNRSPTGSTLTEAGLTFLQTAERIESEILRVQASVSTADVTLSGTVRVGAPDGFGTYFLLPRLNGLLCDQPEITIQLVPLPRRFSLAKREADIAVTIDPPEQGRQHVQKLTDYSLGLYASDAYLRQHGPIDDACVDTHRIITYVPDLLFSPALDYVAEMGLGAARRFECASVIGQMEAVRAGIGIGILHDYAVRGDASFVRILPQRQVIRSYWMVVHDDVREFARVRLVHDVIVALVQQARGMFLAS